MGLASFIFAAPPAAAGETAETIAGKFAADADKPAGVTQQDEKWLHEEAKRAVERALEQENALTAGQAPPAGDDPRPAIEIMATEPASGPSRDIETVPPQVQPDKVPVGRTETGSTAGAREMAVEAPVAAEAGDRAGRRLQIEDDKMLTTDGKELADRLRDVRRRHDAEAAREGQASHGKPAEEPGIVAKAVTGIATQVAGYISPLVEKRVSILIVMDVGHDGVRKWSKTADPMLCIHESCYLSHGPEKPAEKLTRSAAFGPGVALGKRGLACRSSPACIFRDIDLETVEAKLQPIDLRFLRHDRREAKAIRADATCALFDGALSCRAPVTGEGWTAWIVPESVAARAGASGLEAALQKGLD